MPDNPPREPEAVNAKSISVAEEWCTYMDDAVSKAPEPLRKLGVYLAGVLDEDKWKTAERHLNAAALTTRPQPDARRDRLRALSIVICNHLGGGSEWFSSVDGEPFVDPEAVQAELQRRKTDDQITKKALFRQRADARDVVAGLRETITRLEKALELIAGSHWERVGIDQTDVEQIPDLSADEAMNTARDALSFDDLPLTAARQWMEKNSC
jgi:hypothetical protein